MTNPTLIQFHCNALFYWLHAADAVRMYAADARAVCATPEGREACDWLLALALDVLERGGNRMNGLDFKEAYLLTTDLACAEGCTVQSSWGHLVVR